MMKRTFIVGGLRTPIGKTGGVLKHWLPEELAAFVLRAMLTRYGLPAAAIDQVVIGNAAGPGGNLARIAVLQAGWPCACPALTVDSQCGSGLSAVQIAAALVASGQAELVIAGGVESTSMAPRRQFHREHPCFSEDGFYEQAPFAPLFMNSPDVGQAAEQLAAQLAISRIDMDSWALSSHQKAGHTRANHYLDDLIVPLAWPGTPPVQYDECPRSSMTAKLLARMPGAFIAGGNITAGNACLKHDGAAALLIASPKAVKRWALAPAAAIVASTAVGCQPHTFPLAPVAAIRRLLHKTDVSVDDIDAIEINEAFAVKVLACCRQLGIAPERVNRLGGALAYGHPYGASGAIILLHLIRTLQLADERRGIAAIGAVGGLGTAILIERCVNHGD